MASSENKGNNNKNKATKKKIVGCLSVCLSWLYGENAKGSKLVASW